MHDSKSICLVIILTFFLVSGCLKKHKFKEEPNVHQVLQPDGLYSGHGPGSCHHSDHSLHLNAQGHPSWQSKAEDTQNYDHHHSHVYCVPCAKSK